MASNIIPEHEAAAHFAAWHVAGPLEAAGLDLERDGAVVTVWLGGREFTVSVTAAPRQATTTPLIGRLSA